MDLHRRPGHRHLLRQYRSRRSVHSLDQRPVSVLLDRAAGAGGAGGPVGFATHLRCGVPARPAPSGAGRPGDSLSDFCNPRQMASRGTATGLHGVEGQDGARWNRAGRACSTRLPDLLSPGAGVVPATQRVFPDVCGCRRDFSICRGQVDGPRWNLDGLAVDGAAHRAHSDSGNLALGSRGRVRLPASATEAPPHPAGDRAGGGPGAGAGRGRQPDTASAPAAAAVDPDFVALHQRASPAFPAPPGTGDPGAA